MHPLRSYWLCSANFLLHPPNGSPRVINVHILIRKKRPPLSELASGGTLREIALLASRELFRHDAHVPCDPATTEAWQRNPPRAASFSKSQAAPRSPPLSSPAT